MKNLFLASLLLVSSNVFASKLVNVKNLTNKTLDAAVTELSKMDIVTGSATKKVIELKGKGKTAQELRANTIAQALHGVCGFFDDGVSVTINSKDAKGSESAVKDFTDSSNISQDDADYTKLLGLVSTMNKQVGVEVYSGTASGNNTMGTVLGIYDVNTNEIAVWADTNCGSDD
jgi:hypothetical protein